MLASLVSALKLLGPRQRAVVTFLALARVLTNGLDILGLFAIGLLGAMLASGLTERPQASFAGYTISLGSSDQFLILIGLVAAFFLSKSILSVSLHRVTFLYLAKAESQLAGSIAKYLFSGTLSRLQRFSRGDIQFSLNLSTYYASSGLILSGSVVVAEGALFIAVLFVFFLIDASTALVVGIYFLFMFILFQFFVQRRLSRIGRRLGENSVRITDRVQDLISAFREITVLSRNETFTRELLTLRSEYARDNARIGFLSGLPKYFIETGLVLGVMALVGWQFFRGNLTEGVVTTAVFLAGGFRLAASLLPLQNAISNIRASGPQAALAFQLGGLLESPEPESSTRLGARRKIGVLENFPAGLPVEVRNLWFAPEGGDDNILLDVSIDISPGSFVALVGPSGAGKSTLVDLILGLNYPTSGTIRIGNLPPEFLRGAAPGILSYVPQNPGLIAGTIKENVALGQPKDEIDDDRVWHVLEMSQLSAFVRSQSEGINFNLGKNGDVLSGGQRQRLGLARALYSSPKLLVLDEATSALDAEVEADISKVISNFSGEISTLVVAHRMKTIENAEKIFVLEKGKIIGQGNLLELKKDVPLIQQYVSLGNVD